jgi:hypothetical protein
VLLSLSQAEKNVLIEQLNMTLFSALYHMEKDQVRITHL